MKMASEVAFTGSELLEIDICDTGICSEEESGVFLNSDTSVLDGFSAFQQWSAAASPVSDSESQNDTSSPPMISPRGAQQVPSVRNRSASSVGTVSVSLSAKADTGTDPEWHDTDVRGSRASIVDRLLVELYDTYSGGTRTNFDSFDSSTEASSSDAFLGRSNTGSSFLQELQEKHTRRHQMNYLAQKAPAELRAIIREVKYRTGLQSARLLRQLKRRDRLYHKLQKNCDVITACLQAVSQKRRVDTRLKFTIEPSLGKNGFQQWYDALKAVARLPTGIPKEWRKRVWLTLADQYLHSISIDWEKTLRFAFNERSNPDDDSLGIQIVKDLHRTGCSSYCGQEGEQDRVVLKRVLLAYARWNKTVGYCQGFNVLAALILEVTEGNESDALKVMIYLIDKVLPESYFANNLRSLSVDMAVFRDLLRLKLPRLSQHLHHLQKAANREAGGSYEPPLTNVFTMQWFLTMFATCLPAPTVLKIWDSVFFEGSEVLLRVALAIWERLGERIEYCQSADEFYSTMGCLTQEMLEHSLIDPAELMQEVYSMAVFPFPQLAELREKYTYNITPFPTSVKSNGSSGLGNWDSDDDADMDDEDSVITALGCLGPLGGLLAPELQRYQKHLKDQRGEQSNIGELSPGAVGAGGAGLGGGGRAEHQAAINSMMMERMSTDINALKKQYIRIKRRQQQQAMQLYIRTDKCPATSITASQLNPSTPVVNHLLLGQHSPLRRTQASPARHHHGSPASQTSAAGASGGAASPWRAHVRAHRRSIARARAQLGFGDSEDRDEEEEEQGKARATREPETEGVAMVGEKRRESEKDGRDLPASPPDGGGNVDGVSQIEKHLASVELEAELTLSSPGDEHPSSDSSSNPPSGSSPAIEPEAGPQVPILPPPPSSRRRKESESSGSESCDGTPRCAASFTLPPALHRCSAPDSASPAPDSASPAPDSASPAPDSASPAPDSPSPAPDSAPNTASTSDPPAPDSPSSMPNSHTRISASPSTPDLSCVRRPFTSSPSTPSLSSLASTSSSASSKARVLSSPSQPALALSTSPTKASVFSPFPSVKQPRKSLAARNLGLYGPTSRTPTVHFPQLSLNRSATATTTRRR